MKTESEKTAPKTIKAIDSGRVYMQPVRCGKKKCKCARGERHTAHYFYASRNGKRIKIYIRKAEAENFTKLVLQAAAVKSQRREINQSNRKLLKQLRHALREKDSFIRLLKGNKNYD